MLSCWLFESFAFYGSVHVKFRIHLPFLYFFVYLNIVLRLCLFTWLSSIVDVNSIACMGYAMKSVHLMKCLSVHEGLDTKINASYTMLNNPTVTY